MRRRHHGQADGLGLVAARGVTSLLGQHPQQAGLPDAVACRRSRRGTGCRRRPGRSDPSCPVAATGEGRPLHSQRVRFRSGTPESLRLMAIEGLVAALAGFMQRLGHHPFRFRVSPCSRMSTDFSPGRLACPDQALHLRIVAASRSSAGALTMSSPASIAAGCCARRRGRNHVRGKIRHAGGWSARAVVAGHARPRDTPDLRHALLNMPPSGEPIRSDTRPSSPTACKGMRRRCCWRRPRSRRWHRDASINSPLRSTIGQAAPRRNTDASRKKCMKFASSIIFACIMVSCSARCWLSRGDGEAARRRPAHRGNPRSDRTAAHALLQVSPDARHPK